MEYQDDEPETKRAKSNTLDIVKNETKKINIKDIDANNEEIEEDSQIKETRKKKESDLEVAVVQNDVITNLTTEIESSIKSKKKQKIIKEKVDRVNIESEEDKSKNSQEEKCNLKEPVVQTNVKTTLKMKQKRHSSKSKHKKNAKKDKFDKVCIKSAKGESKNSQQEKKSKKKVKKVKINKVHIKSEENENTNLHQENIKHNLENQVAIKILKKSERDINGDTNISLKSTNQIESDNVESNNVIGINVTENNKETLASKSSKDQIKFLKKKQSQNVNRDNKNKLHVSSNKRCDSNNLKKEEKLVNNVVKKHKENRKKNKQTAKIDSLLSPYNVNENDHIVCNACEQRLCNSTRFFNGEPSNGVNEETALVQSQLLLFRGDEKKVSEEDTRAYNKLTSFSIHCKNNHLVALDSELIETDMEVFFSGYIKPIYSDDASTENGIPCKSVGPIVEWWSSGFDIGETPIIALSTEIGDYLLMNPSEEYKPFMESAVKKILISKTVIEFLIYQPSAMYEDLLSKLQVTPIYENLVFTEDVLLQHAQFICDQVMSFDETAHPQESLLVIAPCIRRLIDLAGIKLHQPRHQKQKCYLEHHVGNYGGMLRKLAEDRREKSLTNHLQDRMLPFTTITGAPNKQRGSCGTCERCRRPACTICEACVNKNEDACQQRRCFYREIQEANDEDIRDKIDDPQLVGENSFSIYKETIKSFVSYKNSISWSGQPFAEEPGRIYYAAVKVNDMTIVSGNFVVLRSVDPNIPVQFARVAYLYEDATSGAKFHANYYWTGRDTVLSDAADIKEIFSIGKCEDLPILTITGKVEVDMQRTPANWIKIANNGNLFLNILANSFNINGPTQYYYCQKAYNIETGRFETLPAVENIGNAYSRSKLPYRFCWDCECLQRQNILNSPKLIEEHKENGRVVCKAILYKEVKYQPGSCVYLKPKTLYFKYPMQNYYGKSINLNLKNVDEEKYPEYYSKSNDVVIDWKSKTPTPFDIGYIKEIFKDGNKLYIKVNKLYRPENTRRGEAINRQFDLNLLFWSEEEVVVSFSYVVRKCYMLHAKDININIDEWTKMGPDRFYFVQMYKDKEFYDVDKRDYAIEKEYPDDYPNIPKLKSLDVFPGCGGLSWGLREAGLVESCWTIEPDKIATSTYKLNSPNTTIFIEDRDELLKKIMNGESVLDNKDLPKKGDVHIICGTIPWENFRDENGTSSFYNSAIMTFLSYCRYYQPDFFILEADERLVKKSFFIRTTLACFIKIGFQVAFDVLQVGCYGAPQNRKRTVILGASPNQQLPKYPNHLHVFPKSLCQTSIVIDNKKYSRNNCIDSAPYRTITIRDAISDLPLKTVERNHDVLNYYGKPTSDFQRKMRKNMLEPTLFNHTCKDLGPLVQSRISQIPMAVGSDWRNLPNIEIQLRDGSFTKKLVYHYLNSKTGSRCVCCCSVDGQCDPRDRQEDTLIPWHLVHSSDQHAHWPGLYGRLQWDGCFVSVITNPEPLGNQGPVLHPSQPRVMSVRECARAQGFPDDFILAQDISIHKKYRQIGQSTSPLLALAVGREILRTIVFKNI